MSFAAIGPISTYFPPRIETNEQLQAENPSWDMELIASKTGIHARHIAAPGQTSADLGVLACEKLFEEHNIDRNSVDFLLLCTQTPDYPLPTTACLLQERLGLPTTIGALDFNLGCSGYVYGLAMADGLIRSGVARRVLLVTSETYSKYIHDSDRSLRTIFGDAAAATIIDAADTPTLSAFQFGTDGTGADTLIVQSGGARPVEDAIKPRNRHRWKSDLYMDGPSLISFTVGAIPKVVNDVLNDAGIGDKDVDLYLMHQATLKMLEELRVRLGIEQARMPLALSDCGNTVSSTLPILIERLRQSGELKAGMRSLLIGFGVGWSWGGCVWEESFGS